MLQVGLDRPFGDVEPAADLTVAEPGLHQDEDFAFTRGEEFGGSRRVWCREPCHGL
jgi:hypothetical protein